MRKQINLLKKKFKSFLNKYQNYLEISMRGSDFIFGYVHLLCYKCHKINRNRGGSYTEPPDWIKNKKSNNKSNQ